MDIHANCPGVPQECHNALRQIQSALDGPFDTGRISEIRQNLSHCGTCLDAFDFETDLRRMVAMRCQENAPISLRFKIEDALRHIADH